jgi:PAS domain S-box-containing protein
MENGDLRITGTSDTYLNGGYFNPEAMIGFLNRAAEEAVGAGYSGLRVSGEMTWAFGANLGDNRLIEYEAKLNGFLAAKAAAIICQYNRNRLPATVMAGVFRTHPLVVHGGNLWKNPYFLPSDESGEPDQSMREIERLLANIHTWNEAPQALKKGEERFRMAFAHAAVGMAMLEPDGRILEANPAYCAITGFTDEELRGIRVQSITHPDDLPAYTDLMSRLLNGETPAFALEKRYIRRDGQILWDQQVVSISAPDDPAGKSREMILVSQDITDRKRAEIERRRLASVVEKAPDFIGISDLELNVLFVNQAGQELVGLNGMEEVRTTKLGDYFFAEDRDHVVQKILPEVLEKGTWSGELRLRHFRTGQAIPVMAYEVFRIDNPETGQPMNFAAVVRDITERKLAEQEQQRSFEQLRALAARLQSVREEERTRVAREIHDELGQALTAIKLELACLIGDLPTDQQQSTRTHSVFKLVDETIHTVRRISSELRPGMLDDLGLVAAIEWASEEFEARTGTKCRLDLPEDDIVTDQERATALFRIFQETLTNVARHANATTINVRLTKGNGDLLLEVQDNGKGVSLQDLSAGKSMGIVGMRERALLLGGELIITGAPGEGTTVRVRIPEARRKEPG